jgi:hypothetical protein
MSDSVSTYPSRYQDGARGVTMKNPFDIMRVESDETLFWLEAADNFAVAKLRVRELMLGYPGEYIIFDQELKQLIALFSTEPRMKQRRNKYVEQELSSVSATIGKEESHGYDPVPLW